MLLLHHSLLVITAAAAFPFSLDFRRVGGRIADTPFDKPAKRTKTKFKTRGITPFIHMDQKTSLKLQQDRETMIDFSLAIVAPIQSSGMVIN